jgi:SAM-dependent MidA family methyltransferase
MMGLRDILIARIAQTGPMGLHEYMAECLLHPMLGYYTTAAPFGAAGDFTTAPEISQMFGEMLGLCLAQSWLDQGSPAAFTLAELGPGRGTLMADILRATRKVPGFHAAASIYLIEASPRLRTVQAQALAAYQVTWGDQITALPDGPLWLVANEFFDALPIQQFQRAAQGWCEVLVGASGDQLIFGKSAPRHIDALERRLETTRMGDIVEICPTAPAIVAQICARICAHGGAALILDYGGWDGLGDTFQAVRAHGFADPLANPGAADLTAHVDFAALARAAAPTATCTYTQQGTLLLRLGIAARAQVLAAGMTADAQDAHFTALERLTAPTEMGELFKALGITPKDAPPLAGFDLDETC